MDDNIIERDMVDCFRDIGTELEAAAHILQSIIGTIIKLQELLLQYESNKKN